jgi:hypothetical protein
MALTGDEQWLDADAGRLVRPYAVSEGRTKPSVKLDMLTMILAVGAGGTAGMDPDRAQILALCSYATSVAELAARLRLPAAVTKVIISDLLDSGAVIVRSPSFHSNGPDLSLLQQVLDGLQRLV